VSTTAGHLRANLCYHYVPLIESSTCLCPVDLLHASSLNTGLIFFLGLTFAFLLSAWAAHEEEDAGVVYAATVDIGN
jgi:hypothetical protein